MRNKFILLSLVLLCLVFSITDSSAQFRHIKGIRSIEVGAGITANGYYGTVGFVSYLSNKLYLTIPAHYEIGNYQDTIQFTAISIDPAINYSIFKSSFFYLNAKAGLTASYAFIGSSDYSQIEAAVGPNKFMSYGVSFGVEGEIYISDKLSVVPSLRQVKYFSTDLEGSTTYFAGISFRFAIL